MKLPSNAPLSANHKSNIEAARAFRPRDHTLTPMSGIWGEHWFYTGLTRDDFPQIPNTCYTCENFEPEVIRKINDSSQSYRCKHGIVIRADRDATICKADVTAIHLKRCREREARLAEIRPPSKDSSGQWTLF